MCIICNRFLLQFTIEIQKMLLGTNQGFKFFMAMFLNNILKTFSFPYDGISKIPPLTIWYAWLKTNVSNEQILSETQNALKHLNEMIAIYYINSIILFFFPCPHFVQILTNFRSKTGHCKCFQSVQHLFQQVQNLKHFHVIYNKTILIRTSLQESFKPYH